jgi:phenylacetate-CoA ligase
MTAAPGLLSRIRSGIPGLTWPPAPVGPLAALVALAGYLEESQWLDRAEIDGQQHRQLVVLARHLILNSDSFAARMRSAGLAPEDLAVPTGLRRLPLLRRRDMQNVDEHFFCRTLPEGHGPSRETRTSGSTGEPVRTRRTAVSQLFWRAINLRGHGWFGRDLTRSTTVIRAHLPAVRVQPHWGPPMNLLFETGPLQTIPVRTDIAEQVRLLAEFKPACLIVYPSNLDALIRHCRRHGVAIAGLERILTMGETLWPAVRAEAEALFGARVFDGYSSEELGNIALQCPDSGLYHVMAENLLVEVLDDSGEPCRPGEIGRLVITDLSNFAAPLVRYDIRDHAEVAGPCPCGRGLPSLKRILGRERNILRRPDGQHHWPFLGYWRYRDAAPIVQYQLVQTALDRIEMRLVTETPLTARQESDLAGVVRDGLGYPFDIRFVYFNGEIPRPASGKFEEFLSLLPEDRS